MQKIEIIGYKRANLGKNESKKLREDGNVPCVVYGGKEQIHFHAPMILFRDLVYTPGANFVKLNIEGEEKDVILQDIQFHPVSEVILHADFLELNDNKKVKMEIPVKIFGDSPGVQQGGKILMRIRKLSVMAYPKNMPEFIEVDISGLDLGKSIKVEDLLNDEFDILNSPVVSVVSVNIPRVKIEVEEEEEEGEEGAEEGGEGSEGGEKKDGGSEGASEGGDNKGENKDS
ncbi:MAG: 50S ribosomal protein L25/general stress protein Ctc [Cytophagales bacterium]|nr:MAG: 50S ribosomal protein L25/general stress protein Ctc [Rhodothermaeota bacterium MED-G18]|tara:strand:- start:2955 stop:3644 length:690 start_codon:yes stop_codon:yes gene_type:complete